jgi:hypothetical protein
MSNDKKTNEEMAEAVTEVRNHTFVYPTPQPQPVNTQPDAEAEARNFVFAYPEGK